MLEVEIKLPVPNLEDIKQNLEQMGFQLLHTICEKDAYFDNAQQYIRHSGLALRIRTVKDLELQSEETVVTFKGKKLDTTSMTRQELETEVASGEVLSGIFHAIGLREVQPIVVKNRREMVRGDVHACLDEVQGLGSFLELEIVQKEENDREAALARLEELLKELGFSISDTVTTSYLSMLQHTED